MLTNRFQWIILLLFSVLSVVVYFPSLDAPFYLDDFDSILNNSVVTSTFSWQQLNELFSFRQLTYASFNFNYAFSQTDPGSYRWLNIAIHLMVSGAIFFFTNKLLQYTKQELSTETIKWVALFAASLFLLAPLNSQSLIYVSQRGVLFVALFFVVGLNSYLKFREETALGKRLISGAIVILCFALGMISKQNMVAFPFAILLLEIFLIRRYKLLSLLNFFSVIFCAFLIVTIVDFLGGIGIIFRVDNILLQTDVYSRWEYFTHQLVLFWVYLYKFILPHPLLLEYPVTNYNWNNNVTWFALFGHLILVGCIYYFRNKKPVISLLILTVYLVHALESSFVAILPDLGFEHRAYLPNVFISILFVYLLGALFGSNTKSRVLYASLFSMILVLSYFTYERADKWNKKLDFLRHELTYTTDNSRLYGSVALLYAEMGNLPTANSWAKMALQIGTEHGDISASIVTQYMDILYRLDKVGEANRTASLALSITTNHNAKARIFKRLARHKIESGNCAFAAGLLKQALLNKPNDVEASYLLEQCGG